MLFRSTGEQKYTPIRFSSSWLNVVYGQKWKPGVFVGYAKNLGTSDELYAPDGKAQLYGTGTNLDQLVTAGAELTYNVPHWKFGLEYTLSSAWYGSLNTSSGKIKDTHAVCNTRLLTKFGIEYPDELSSIVDTIVVCAIGTKYAGYLLLSDTLKEDAVNAVKELKALNINNIQILSGDKQAIVTNFAEKLGITQAYGDLLPDGKVKHIEALRSNPANRIAFVGDGINDAPVLALSHVGIAMGGLGSDAAIETADVVIQTDQPSRVATAIHAGRQTRRIVWQNISLAFGVKLLVLILGAGGIATLWEAVFADVGVALIAIVNAIRIQKLIK